MNILKLKSIFFSLMAIAMVTVFLTSCEDDFITQDSNLQEQNNDHQLANVKFTSPVSTDYLAELTDIVDIVFVEHKYKLGEETYSGFCNVSGKKESSEILNTLQKEFEIFVKDIEIHQNSEEMKNANTSKVEIPANLNFRDNKYYKIIGIQVKGNDDELKQIENIEKVTSVVKSKDINKDAKVINSRSGSGPCWLPKSGYVKFGQSYVAHNRYVYSKFKWDCSYGINDDWTYEHDIWLNNYNNNAGIYLSEKITYASSNMPQNLYLDTPFLDGPKEVSFSIGTTRLKDVKLNVDYNIYIRTENGNVNSDKFKLQPQQGNRTPAGCHSTWCIFSGKSARLIKAWSSNVPGTTWF